MQTTLNCNLLAHTPDPERVVAAAARLCYSKSDAATLMQNMTQNKVESFVRKLESLGHDSPFEHVSFTFGVDGVSRVLTHQNTRHRMASYSQQSQRYVTADEFDYIIPPTISNNSEALMEFVTMMDRIQRSYDRLCNLGVPKEDARYVLPNAAETKIVITMNARSLFNFFHHRCCVRAQWEIRQLANTMLSQVTEVAPNIFRHAGANCKKGVCPEGAMSCGAAPTLESILQNHGSLMQKLAKY